MSRAFSSVTSRFLSWVRDHGMTVVRVRIFAREVSLARLTRRSAHALEPDRGQMVYARIKTVALLG